LSAGWKRVFGSGRENVKGKYELKLEFVGG